jgi:hypothetical protein
MAILQQAQGKPDEAEPLFTEVLSARRRTQGHDHPRTLISIFNFALFLQAQGKRAEAVELSRQAIAGFRRVLGEGHPNTQNALRLYNQLQ